MVEDEVALTAAIVALALRYGRYDYRRITAMLRRDGWTVTVKRVKRIWRREGLKVPARQPKRARLWLNDGSCLRLAAGATQPRLVVRIGRFAPAFGSSSTARTTGASTGC